MSQYELSDVSVKYKSEDLASATSGKTTPSGGMFVSTAKGFILAFLAIAITVGVGLIVHFAGSSKNVECTCTVPEVGGVAAALAECKDLATGGSADICNACPKSPGTCPPDSTATSPGATTTTIATSAPTTAPPVLDVRLPLRLVPLVYTVELQPHMYAPLEPDQFTFNGSVKILLHCVETTRTITLHSNKLNITGGMMVTAENSVDDMYAGHEFDLERQFLLVHTGRDLVAGRNYTLHITHFVGPLVADLAGLYLSSYTRGNETIHIATTQMQPTDARKTFPCWDEPAIKSAFDVTLLRKAHMTSISNMPLDGAPEDRYLATSFMAPSYARKALPCFDEPAVRAEFAITLVRRAGLRALSNMPLEGTEARGNGWFADKFQRTPKMSTYLLAFIISDFEYLENVTTNNVKYRAWSRPEAIDQAPYSLQVGVDILTYFEDYFNVSYPLPKQDMIAIPDFAAGAMENWGLITYRETAMLYQPGVSSEGNKQRVAVVVSHELAHQWFGNLVTPSWWDDLWLNEGFASYVEYMGVDHVHKDWKMFDQFVVEDLQDVFNFDGLISSHPVYVPVSHPDQINEIFDRISYAKGASIIRMMRFFLGDHTFQKGLTRYLRQLEYDAAFHDDLWYALGNQSVADGNAITDVKAIMDTWTLQMNFPVVMVTFSRAGQISLTQSRYLTDPAAPDPGQYVSPFGYKWDIPFAYTTSSEMKYNVTSADVTMMRRGVPELVIQGGQIPTPGDGRWVLGNPGQFGYYRVNYDQRNWDALIAQLRTEHTAIHPVNRAQIINDAWNLAKSGELGMSTALRTTEYLTGEREYVPWHAADAELGFVRSMLQRHPMYGSYKRFMQDKTRGVFQELTMNNTGATHLQSYLRSLISGLACSYDNPDCIGEATRLFKQWMDDPQNNPIDPGLKTTVYCTAVAAGGIAEWEFVLAQYRAANLAAEKARLQYALACSRQPWILTKYLEMAINPEEIRRQDAVSAIVSVSRNIIGRHLAWSFFVTNWDFLLKDFGAGSFAFSRLISGLTSTYNDVMGQEQLKAFIDSREDLGSGQRAFAQALEKTQSNINWMTKNVPVIQTWLQSQGY